MVTLAAIAGLRHSHWRARRNHRPHFRFGATSVQQSSPNWLVDHYRSYAVSQEQDQAGSSPFAVVAIGKDGSNTSVTAFTDKKKAADEYDRITNAPGGVAYAALFDKKENATGPIDEGFFVAFSEIDQTVTKTNTVVAPPPPPVHLDPVYVPPPFPVVDTSNPTRFTNVPSRDASIDYHPPTLASIQAASVDQPTSSGHGLGIAAAVVGGLGGFLLLASKKAR